LHLFGEIADAAVPGRVTTPSVGVSTPAIIFNKVLLPHPFSPMSPTFWPRLTLKETRVKIGSDSKRLVTLFTSRTVMSSTCRARTTKGREQCPQPK
jgi:hypothetical protein